MYKVRFLGTVVVLLAVSLVLGAAKKRDDETKKEDKKPSWDLSAPPGTWDTVAIDTTVDESARS